MNGKIQQQSAQAAEQSKQQTLQMNAQMEMEMEKLKNQLASQLQKEKYKYELEIEEIRQASKLEQNAINNLPTKEMGMKIIDQPGVEL